MRTHNNLASTLALGLLLASLPLLGACNGDRGSPEERSAIRESIRENIRGAMNEARQEIATGNISVSKGNGQPKAEISPEGDFIVDGRKVDLTPEQRKLVLEYRGHIASIAESGMEIGMQGADVAATAMGEALKGVFTGKSEEDIRKSVEAEAGKIKESASKLCGRLPAMMATQQKLAAALPEFRPYATMTQDDIDDCRVDSGDLHVNLDTDGKGDGDAASAADEADKAASKPAQ